jgi:hypothetical protein
MTNFIKRYMFYVDRGYLITKEALILGLESIGMIALLIIFFPFWILGKLGI